jgi:hypothetical protein
LGRPIINKPTTGIGASRPLHASPAHAVVLSIDEKSQIQALDRTQSGLPLKPGKCGTMTHDYKCHGTTTLFAAVNVLEAWCSAAACKGTPIRS